MGDVFFSQTITFNPLLSVNVLIGKLMAFEVNAMKQ
jgi:hypothetical protein